MKCVLIVLGALVGIVVLVALIGAFIPRDHVAASAVVIRQPPDSVWKTVRGLEGLSAWWPEMQESRRVDDPAGREVWAQKMKNGFVMRAVVTESVAPTKLVTTIDAPPGAPFGGSWTYEIAPAPEGSRVTVTERGWIANPIFRFMSKVIFGYYGSQDGYLKALGRKFGEAVRPVHQERLTAPPATPGRN